MSIAKVLGIETEYGIIATGVDSSPVTSSSLLLNSSVSRVDATICWDFDAVRPGSDARGFSLDGGFSQEIELSTVIYVFKIWAGYYGCLFFFSDCLLLYRVFY